MIDLLLEVLTDARDRGLLGPGPVEAHRAHGEGFAGGWSVTPELVVDLGSGGGVPGLVLAVVDPGLRIVLVDGRERSARWLHEAVARLNLESRVSVVQMRAEELARDPEWRGRVPVVVARGMGPPAVVAECAAPLLGLAGRVVVSEPPEPAAARWPPDGLAEVGLALGPTWETESGHYRRLDRVAPCPDRFPRRTGIPAKRPLW